MTPPAQPESRSARVTVNKDVLFDAQKRPVGFLGRSHRSKLGKAKLADVIERTRKVLAIPAEHRIGIVPASDTGAVEMAMWSLLGARGVATC